MFKVKDEDVEKEIDHLMKSNATFEDAKFMLVSCSAFINYLNEKINK